MKRFGSTTGSIGENFDPTSTVKNANDISANRNQDNHNQNGNKNNHENSQIIPQQIEEDLARPTDYDKLFDIHHSTLADRTPPQVVYRIMT